MRICIPVEASEGLRSKVHGHFGSAPYFMIGETDQKDFFVLDNANQHHSHGMCHPLQAISGQKIQAVICRGMGARAVQKLNQAGIKVYRSSAETVAEILDNFQNGIQEEITASNACRDHECH